MRTIRMLSCALLVGAMAVVTPGGAASAAPAMTYAGEFAGVIEYTECTVGIPPVDVEASGPWSIELKRTSAKGALPTAKGTFHILKDDSPYLSYVFPNMTLDEGWGADSFSVSGPTAAGPLTVTLEDGNMTYTIVPYNMGDLSCTSVTYHGHT